MQERGDLQDVLVLQDSLRVAEAMTASEKLRYIEQRRKTQIQDEIAGGDLLRALPQIRALVEAVPALIDCPNLDAPYHTTVNCTFCSAAPVRAAVTALTALDEALP